MGGHWEADQWFDDATSVKDLAGIIPYNGPPVSIEEMDDAIAEAVVEKYMRSWTG